MKKNEKKDESKTIDEKITKLCLFYSIEDSKLIIKYLENELEFYQKQRKFLEKNKPFIFQSKKMNEYLEKREEYNDLISKCHQKMNKEVDLIIELSECLGD